MTRDDDRRIPLGGNPFESPPPPVVDSEVVNVFVGDSPTEEHYRLAKDLLDENAGFPLIREQLLKNGATIQQADVVIQDLAEKLVNVLFVAGADPEKVEAPLYHRGMDVTQVQKVLDALRRKHGRALRGSGLQAGRLYLVACIFFVTGLFVAVGHASGLAPTAYGAGQLLMIIGVVFAFCSYHRSRRRR